ncbi:MAG: aminotransferase class IV [Acidimicrobiales bacterium]
MTEPGVVWINGRLAQGSHALLTVTDRGFQLGDGVFETIRVLSGNPLELSLHTSRLKASAAVLAITLPDDLEEILPGAIAQLCAANSLDDPGSTVAVRITASRGPVVGRALLPPEACEPSLVIQAWRVDPPKPELLERGLSLIISEVRRDPASPLAKVKTTSRAELVYARLEAHHRGVDDALLLTTDGHIAEATSASIFLVEASGLATPSLDCGVLVSTTRGWIISAGARALGLAVRQAWLLPDDLFAADEVFLASSVAGIVPVTSVESRPIGGGSPGAVTTRLRAAREKMASDLTL